MWSADGGQLSGQEELLKGGLFLVLFADELVSLLNVGLELFESDLDELGLVVGDLANAQALLEALLLLNFCEIKQRERG